MSKRSQSSKNMLKQVFGSNISSTAILGIEDDYIAQQICDWKIFEQKVVNDENLRLPSFFLNDQIKSDEWKNIPIPVVEALEIMKQTFFNLENLFISLTKESKNRSVNVVKRIQ